MINNYGEIDWLVVGCWWLVMVVGSRVRDHGGCRGRSRGHRHQQEHGCREVCKICFSTFPIGSEIE